MSGTKKALDKQLSNEGSHHCRVNIKAGSDQPRGDTEEHILTSKTLFPWTQLMITLPLIQLQCTIGTYGVNWDPKGDVALVLYLWIWFSICDSWGKRCLAPGGSRLRFNDQLSSGPKTTSSRGWDLLSYRQWWEEGLTHSRYSRNINWMNESPHIFILLDSVHPSSCSRFLGTLNLSSATVGIPLGIQLCIPMNSKLQTTGQVQLIAFFCTAHELRELSHF